MSHIPRSLSDLLDEIRPQAHVPALLHCAPHKSNSVIPQLLAYAVGLSPSSLSPHWTPNAWTGSPTKQALQEYCQSAE